MKKQAKVTSKGQVTVPREIRRKFGVRAGDRLLFEEDGDGVRVTAVRSESPFAKYRGIGTPGIGKGRKGIQKWLRELRGVFPTADAAGKFTVFNIKGNAYRLITEINYHTGTIFLRHVPTHAEYSKGAWKE